MSRRMTRSWRRSRSAVTRTSRSSPRKRGPRVKNWMPVFAGMSGECGKVRKTNARLRVRLRGEKEQMSSLNRRRFLASTALGAAALAAPAVLRAQGAPIKVGILQPTSGAMSYSGQQGRIGATLALEEINAAGHQVARRREDRAGVRRRAVDAGRRQRRSREDERGRLRGGRRRLCLVDLPCGEPDRGALRPALYRRRRRRRLDRDARAEEHVPLRPRLRRDRQDRDRQPRSRSTTRPARSPRP